MTQTSAVSFRCPSCGSTDTLDGAQTRFGLRFACQYCGTRSVVVVGHELYTPRPGEHVCLQCGRVAASTARFCQCGQSMLRQCSSRWCGKDLSVDDDVCDRCGWLQAVSWDSPQGQERALAVAPPCSDPSFTKVLPPEVGIPQLVKALPPDGSGTWETVFFAISKYGAAAYPTLVKLVVANPSRLRVQRLCEFGSAAVPALIQFLDTGAFKQEATWAIGTLAESEVKSSDPRNPVEPAAAKAIPSLLRLLDNEEDLTWVERALRAMGPAVIPQLRPYTGLFKRSPMKRIAERTISSIEYELRHSAR
jgi:hypothetical protein